MDLKKNKKGFTLVELIVVLVIIGILLAMVIPNLTGYIDRAQIKNTEAEARSIYMAAMTLAAEEYAAGNVTAKTLAVGSLTDLAKIRGNMPDNISVTAGELTSSFSYKVGKFTTTVSKAGTMTTVKGN